MEAALLASLSQQLDCDFSLVVVQESQRARMAGFGDRDRRPLTPPLICKLVAKDRKTGRVISPDEIDTSFFILAADLATEDYQDANLIRHPNSFGYGVVHSPYQAINSAFNTPNPDRSAQSSAAHSVASPTSSLHESDSPKEGDGDDDDERGPRSPRLKAESDGHSSRRSSFEGAELTAAFAPPMAKPSGMPAEPTASTSTALFSDSNPVPSPPAPAPLPKAYDEVESKHSPEGDSPKLRKKRRLSNSAFANYHLQTSAPSTAWAAPVGVVPTSIRSQLLAPPAHATNVYLPHRSELEYAEPPGTTVPNLIGALHTNAFKLKDDKGEKGIFFIFHDLSVRTEGRFRLRLRFLSIGAGAGARSSKSSSIVASTYSQPFAVSSAKKFEGMMDPTPLSQCMAKQGVRIPTRKVARSRDKQGSSKGGPSRGANGEEDELDED